MKTICAAIISSLILLGAPLTGCRAAGEEPFVIGVILPLSGAYQSLGSGVRDGIEFAYQQLSPEERRRLKVVYEDDGLQAPRSVAAFQKLRKLNHAQAFIAVSSGIGHALAPLAEQEQVPLIAVGASDFKITRSRSYTFLHWIIPEIEAAAMAQETKRRGYQRIGIITAEQQGWIALHDQFLTQLGVEGIRDRVVLDERRLPDDMNFHSTVAKLQSKDAQVIFMLLMPEPIVSFVKQLRGGGGRADVVGPEMFEDQAVLDAVGEMLYGQWYVNADNALPEFETKYKREMGRGPGFGVTNSYDSLNLLVEASVKRGLRGQEIAEYLRTLKDYQGAAGRYSATGDNRFTLPVAVKKVSKGGAEKLR